MVVEREKIRSGTYRKWCWKLQEVAKIFVILATIYCEETDISCHSGKREKIMSVHFSRLHTHMYYVSQGGTPGGIFCQHYHSIEKLYIDNHIHQFLWI